MKTRLAFLTLVLSMCAWAAMAQDRPAPPHQGGHEPPPQAYEDCKGKKAGDVVQHTTPEGKVEATCVDSPKGLAARPNLSPDNQPRVEPQRSHGPQGSSLRYDANRYSIGQAISDQAQLHTIAFDGLAFLTGDFASDTFLPHGKVSDYFGFQYMRDIDAVEGGHNTSFLTRIANNMLAVLNNGQKAQLLALGKA
jgi:hypothetical protein